jgi:periplasmic protein CpxP/Spy
MFFRPWIKRTLVVALGAGLLAGGLSACAHRPSGPLSDEQVAAFRTKAVDRISSRLDLNELQKGKLGVLADELIAQRRALHAGGDARSEMQAVIAGPTFDRAKAQALFDQKAQVLQGASPKVIAALGDFYDSLTPEQQQKVRQHLQDRHGFWHHG